MKIELLVYFQAKNVLIVRIVRPNASIINYVIHDLVSSVVEDLKCVHLVIALLGQPEA
jgi:hypothetical protein